MRRKWMWTLTAVLLAIVLGAGSALVRLRWFVNLGSVAVGPWQTSTEIGSAHADALLRAAIAVNAILAMNRDEAMYFIARTDSAGKPLDGRCHYRIQGTDPATRWWSITVYGADRFLVPNAAHRYSVSRDSVSRDAQSQFTIRLAPQAPAGVADGDWIATPPGRFLMTLRLYQPAASITADASAARLPEVVAEDCA